MKREASTFMLSWWQRGGGAMSQCPEMILNKIEKTFNKTYTLYRSKEVFSGILTLFF